MPNLEGHGTQFNLTPDDDFDGVCAGGFSPAEADQRAVLERIIAKWAKPDAFDGLPIDEGFKEMLLDPGQASVEAGLSGILSIGFSGFIHSLMREGYSRQGGGAISPVVSPEIKVDTSVPQHTVAIKCASDSVLASRLADYNKDGTYEMPLKTLMELLIPEVADLEADRSDEEALDADADADVDEAELDFDPVGRDALLSIVYAVTASFEESCELVQILFPPDAELYQAPYSIERDPGRSVTIRGNFSGDALTELVGESDYSSL